MKREAVQDDPSAIEEPNEESDQKDEKEPNNPSPVQPTVQEYKPQVPYPSRLKADKEDT